MATEGKYESPHKPSECPLPPIDEHTCVHGNESSQPERSEQPLASDEALAALRAKLSGATWTEERGREYEIEPPPPIPEPEIKDAHPLTAAIIKAILENDPDNGWLQWYVDDNCIDCNAEEFWNTVDKVVRKYFDNLTSAVQATVNNLASAMRSLSQ